MRLGPARASQDDELSSLRERARRYTLLIDAVTGPDADQLDKLAITASLIGRDQNSVRA